jgi:hypothetical protein
MLLKGYGPSGLLRPGRAQNRRVLFIFDTVFTRLGLCYLPTVGKVRGCLFC